MTFPAPSVRNHATVARWAEAAGWVADELEASGVGDITAVAGICPSVTITLLDVPVEVSSSTVFVSGACADLRAGRRVEVHATLIASGSTLSAVATRIELLGGGRRVTGEGTVASLFGTCPNLSMVVHGIRVTTSAATLFEHGECGNLRPGTKIQVEGDLHGDRDLVATRLRILDQPGGPPVEGEGTAASVHGTCPTLTMVVHGHPVMTTSATVFTGGRCTDIRPGTRIFVRGTIEGGSVLAREVEIRSR